ncbi:MAG: flagellar hook-associated protein 3 [Acidobacteria bacterium]|jgi:flagellar hook-associated protein 3 FlgL|nr:MAG: flagellar hook-associated protein 3 [Acidobacteriota bacterium]
MRVNPNYTPGLLAALATTQKEEQKALQEMSSGRRVNVPSDDPTAAAVLVGNHSRADQADQFLRSLSGIQAELQTADSTLNSVVLALQRAITLGVQGANGTLSSANRASLVGELQGLQQQLVSLANTTFQGSFIFAGTESRTQPFVADATQPSGVRYDGNTGVNSVAVGDGFNVQVNIPGSQLFMAAGGGVFQSINVLIVALQNDTGMDIAVAGVRQAFDQVTAQRVFYGNVLNQLTSQQTFLNNSKLALNEQENQIGGADLAAAASRLVNAENARNAALAAAGRISGSSLFDYLK